MFASDDDDEELVAHDDYEHVDLPELEDRPPISSEGGLSAYFRRRGLRERADAIVRVEHAEQPLAADACIQRIDSLTRLHRAPPQATAEHRFWSITPSEQADRVERIRTARESLVLNEQRLDEAWRDRQLEQAWRQQENHLRNHGIATSIDQGPPAVQQQQQQQEAASQATRRQSRSPFTAAAQPQHRRSNQPSNQQSNRSFGRRRSRNQRSRSRRRTGAASRNRPLAFDCGVGGTSEPLHTHPTPLQSNIVRKVDRPSLMELKFELDTRLTVSCITVLACVYGFTTVSIAIGSVLLAFAYAIILLLIIFILFGLKDILTRKPSPQFK